MVATETQRWLKMSQNIFLQNLNQDYRQDLVNLRTNQQFAENLIRQISQVYQVETSFKRRDDKRSEYVLDKHHYSRYQTAEIEITPEAVKLTTYVSPETLEFMLDDSINIYNMEREAFDKLPDSGTRHFQGYDARRLDQAKSQVDKKLNELFNPKGFEIKRDRDTACGDSFAMITALAQDETLNSKIKILMLAFQKKGVKFRLEAI